MRQSTLTLHLPMDWYDWTEKYRDVQAKVIERLRQYLSHTVLPHEKAYKQQAISYFPYFFPPRQLCAGCAGILCQDELWEGQDGVDPHAFGLGDVGGSGDATNWRIQEHGGTCEGQTWHNWEEETPVPGSLNPGSLNLGWLNPGWPNLGMIEPTLLNPGWLNLGMIEPTFLNLSMIEPNFLNLQESEDLGRTQITLFFLKW